MEEQPSDRRKVGRSIRPPGSMDKKNAMRIEDWGTFARGGDFDAPELCRLAVTGICLDGKNAGKRIRTSCVVDVEGRYVRTKSGSTYVLGQPAADFLEYLRENNFDFDPEHPIKVRTRKKVVDPSLN